MKIRSLVAMILLSIGVNSWAVEINPTGSWSVKSTVSMNTCKGVKMGRVTSEQWVINQTNDAYQIQVVGNINTKLIYIADYASVDGEGFMLGRYTGTEGWKNQKGFSDVQLGFSGAETKGLRVDVNFEGTGCSTVSSLELKKMN